MCIRAFVVWEPKTQFSWEEKFIAPLIATPNVDRAIEDKKDGQKSYATGYTCNSRLQKGITVLFCKQIGQCPSLNYASSLSGFKILGKLKWQWVWRILGGRFSLSMMQWWWVCFWGCSIEKTMMSFQKSEDRWWKTQDVGLCVRISMSHTSV